MDFSACVGIDIERMGLRSERLIEFLIEQRQEDNQSYADYRKDPECQVPENPERASGAQVDIGIEETDTPGNEEYQSHYHKKDQHIYTIILLFK